MKVTILGCGGAGGVPMISAGWVNCDPENPRNVRRRPAILVEDGEDRLLVDTPPDLRAQLLDANVRWLSAVLFTHYHADHLHGLDDLREVNRAMHEPLPMYADADTVEVMRDRFGYALRAPDPGVGVIYRPLLTPHIIEGSFRIGRIPVQCFRQDHGYMETLGFRFGPVAYSTDAVELPEEAFDILSGVKLWIVGCLQDTPHTTHAHVDKVLGWIERVRPERAVLTHMGPKLDYETLRQRLPAHVEPAYDGMVLDA